MHKKTKSGFASLPAILLLGGVIIEVSIASALLVFHLNNSVYGSRLSNEAFVIAKSGLEDAVMRILLNKDCPDATCAPSGEYSLNIGGGVADVLICKNICDDIPEVSIGQHGVISTGKVLTRRQRLISVIDVDEETGLISINSLKELAE